MPKIRLTKEVIEGLKPGTLRAIYWDTGVTGFGVRVFPSGVKTFLVSYRAAGRPRRLALGDFGVIGVDEARRRAREVIVDAGRGVDAIEQRREAARRGISLDQLFELWMERHVRPKRSARTAHDYMRIYGAYIRGRLGRRTVASLRRSDVSEMHHALRDMPRTANYCVVVLKALLNFGIAAEHISEGYANPATKIEQYKENARERFLSNDELRRIGLAMREVAQEGPISGRAVAALALCLLTGARSGLVRQLRWREVRLDLGILELETPKKGVKTVVLNAAAARLLSGIDRVEGNEYVFVGRRAGRPLESLRRAWERVCEIASIKGVRIHDLRHSYASFAISAGTPLAIVGKQLGHTQPRTTARYAHLIPDAVRQSAENTGGMISGLLEGKS